MKGDHIPRLKKITTSGPFAGNWFMVRCYICGTGTGHIRTEAAAWEAWRELKARKDDCVPEGRQNLTGFKGRIVRKEG